ncbi:MAG: MFS transporter [Muribaculaceae bacterium]|nr:MFS transporter [Muribaculaceae bacterium]MDE6094086.1 MFS transporter [Muribaculaceae bacterium]
MSKLVQKKYILPFALITSLFFMWGFARATLDVLNKHFQESLSISITQSTLIQATTYLGYFLMAIPAGIIITRMGYRRGVVIGLLLFAIGSLLFIPGASAMSFAIFLAALFVIGCGLVILETAANPYASVLGSPETAASRLNLAQSFNGLGCIIAPVLVGGFIFSGDSGVDIPYAVMGVIVLIVALIFSRVKLPEIASDTCQTEQTQTSAISTIRTLLSDSVFRFGLFALFCYEIAEISINSLFINYTTAEGWMDKTIASAVLSFGALGLFMLARIGGSWIMSRIRAERVLAVCGLMTVLSALLVAMDLGLLSKIGLFSCYAFEAIMFPTIFAITIARVGSSSVKLASSLLMMTPIGGAVGTLLMGLVADATSMSVSFVVPAAGYFFVFLYSISRLRATSKTA